MSFQFYYTDKIPDKGIYKKKPNRDFSSAEKFLMNNETKEKTFNPDYDEEQGKSAARYIKKNDPDLKKQYEIDKQTPGHDDYDYKETRVSHYGSAEQQFEILIEKIEKNGGDVVKALKELADRNLAIKQKYPKPQ